MKLKACVLLMPAKSHAHERKRVKLVARTKHRTHSEKRSHANAFQIYTNSFRFEAEHPTAGWQTVADMKTSHLRLVECKVREGDFF